MSDMCGDNQLGCTLSKSSGSRCGNWEAPVLPPKMLDYAALDVYASYSITKRLCLGIRHLPTLAFGVSEILALRERSTNNNIAVETPNGDENTANNEANEAPGVA